MEFIVGYPMVSLGFSCGISVFWCWTASLLLLHKDLQVKWKTKHSNLMAEQSSFLPDTSSLSVKKLGKHFKEPEELNNLLAPCFS